MCCQQSWLSRELSISAFCLRALKPPTGERLDLVLTSFFKQELAHFSNDQRFVYYAHAVAGVMQFDDSRVLHARAEPLDWARLRDSGDQGRSHAGATTRSSRTGTNWRKT